MNIRLSLPSAPRTSCIATSEPSASPSGFSWVTSRKRSASRSSARTSPGTPSCRWPPAPSSPPGLPVEQLGHAHPAVDGVVVGELQRRRVLERSSPATRRCRKPWAERRPSSEASRAVGVAEHAHVHARMAQVGAGPDTVTVTNPTRGSFRSVAMASLSTCRTASSTRRMRRAHPIHGGPRQKPRRARRARPPGSGRRASARRGRPPRRAGAWTRRRARPSASPAASGPGGRPRRRRAEALAQMRLDRGELLALGLQASGVREVQVDHQDGDEAGRLRLRLRELALDLAGLVGLEHVALLHVLEVPSTMPHSKPAATSPTSSLKRRRLAISPS